jgi:signal transduction histidine kinase
LKDGELKLLRHRGYAEQAVERVRTIALGEPVPVARTASHGQAIWLECHADYEREFPSFARFTASLPTHATEIAIAALPLTIRGRVIGALGISFVGRRTFSEPERAFLTLLAQHCAQGLERARLYEEAQRAEQRSSFLAQVSGLLASSLDQQTALRDLAELVVPKMADWCLVALIGSDGSLTAAAVKHADPEKTALAERVRASYPLERDAAIGIYRVLQTGEAELHARLSQEASTVLALDAEHMRLIGELGSESAMIVPVRAHGRTFGSMTFVSADERRIFDQADLAVAVQVGERAGVAVYNADLYQRAVTAVQLRDEFLSVAGHELRTPLTALLLQAQSLARSASDDVPDPSRVRLGAERLTRNATRLSKLVDELLDVTRITSGRLQLSREPLDLGELVDEVIQGANEQIERARTSVRCRVAESVRGVWDRHRLEQVAMNLLSNALKYGGEQPIDVALGSADGHAVLSVRDYGIGVPEADQRRIFGRFERAVSTRNFGGLGLGLWIAREIVEAHGGTISVCSERGKGAEFTVRLPLQQS